MDYDTISFFYSLGFLDPAADWYCLHKFITSEQYKEITGNDYKAPEAAK